MKAYKVELLIIDFDKLGEESLRYQLENASYPNDCVSPTVMAIRGRDVGPWHDDHALNSRSTRATAYDFLFGENEPQSNE